MTYLVALSTHSFNRIYFLEDRVGDAEIVVDADGVTTWSQVIKWRILTGSTISCAKNAW